MIRVLVVESTMFGYDGITNVMTNYYEHINRNRVHMDIVTPNEVSEKFKRVLTKNNSLNFILPYRNRNPLKYILKLKKILKNREYDVVHVHGCSATMAVEMLAAKLAGIKVRIAHSHNTTCDHVIIDKILRPLFNGLCNAGFACGIEAGEWLFPKKEFSIMSNGIDLAKFQFDEQVRNEFRRKYNFEEKTVIGHVGRFSEQKNHRKLIEIFAEYSKEYSNAKLVLIGDGPLRKEIEERVSQEKLDVIFVGLSDEVEKWLQAIDVIVFPSLFEGFPLGLVEAQAAGLPCVLSDTITSEVKLTSAVRFLKIDEIPEKWCVCINELLSKVNRSSMKEEVMRQIREAHYDIRKNCVELENQYELLFRKNGGNQQ